MKTFVLGDIHGAAKALEQCLDRSGFDMDNDLLIQLGDVVDRYDEVFECVEILLQVKNLIAIKGNHDDWFDNFLRTGVHPRDWIFGGLDTVESYLRHVGKEKKFTEDGEGWATNLLPKDVPAEHCDFFSRQRLYLVDERNRCFVHGGFMPKIPLEQQRPEDFYWDRMLWQNAYDHQRIFGGRILPGDMVLIPDFHEVYLGHTPTTKWGSDRPLNAFNIWNMDTGAAYSGRLTIMDVDTKDYWQSDLVSTLYAGKPRH